MNTETYVDVPEVKHKELIGKRDGEPSAVITERVSRPRMRRMERFASDGILCNAQMGPRQQEEHCRLHVEASKQLKKTIVDFGFPPALTMRRWTSVPFH